MAECLDVVLDVSGYRKVVKLVHRSVWCIAMDARRCCNPSGITWALHVPRPRTTVDHALRKTVMRHEGSKTK
jgi:hypothetical protein